MNLRRLIRSAQTIITPAILRFMTVLRERSYGATNPPHPFSINSNMRLTAMQFEFGDPVVTAPLFLGSVMDSIRARFQLID